MAVQLGFPDKYYICARYGTEVLLNDASISDSDKLLIYALGQQAEYGENKTPKPSIFDTVARAKWNAWAELGKRSPFEYDPKKDVLAAPGCVLRTFDKVRVQIRVDSSRPHRPKLDLAIVEPVLPK